MIMAHQVKTCLFFARLTRKFHPVCIAAAVSTSSSALRGMYAPDYDKLMCAMAQGSISTQLHCETNIPQLPESTKTCLSRILLATLSLTDGSHRARHYI